MLKKIAPIMIILCAALVGGGGGVFAKLRLAPKVVPSDEAAIHAADKAHENEDVKITDASDKKGGTGDNHGAASPARVFTFGRQFVVPVVENGRPRLMVLLDVGIEIDSSVDDSAYSREPMLRDAMLTKMLALSHDGVLGEIASDVEALRVTKEALLEPALEYLGDGARRILVQDMAVQPY